MPEKWFVVAEVQAACPSVSPSFVESLGRYFNGGIIPGGFLTACLKSDLAEAVRRADPESLEQLRDLMRLLDNHAPAAAWGSPAAVETWLERIREERTPTLAKGVPR